MSDYLDYVLEQLEGLGVVTPRNMFGGVGLYCAGTMFALIARDDLYMKVDDSNRSDYEARESEPFRPYADQSKSMSYYELPVDVLEKPKQAAEWAARSLAIAKAAKAKNKPRPRSRKGSQMPAKSVGIRALRNLGPKSAEWLRAVGITTRADLERVGSIGAFRMVKESGVSVSLNLLYALEGALLDERWDALPPPLKDRLRAAAKALQGG